MRYIFHDVQLYTMHTNRLQTGSLLSVQCTSVHNIKVDCMSIIWPISAYRIVCQQTLPVVAWILDVNNVSE